ncbi:MAG: RNA 2',3'-cyclic phosphodiesterase [Candidatus Acidiferrales bacterium]
MQYAVIFFFQRQAERKYMRLFIALDLPDAVRRALDELIAQLKPKSRSARWVRPESMHLTLKFIGNIAGEKLDAIRAALGRIRSAQPLDLHFCALGFFPDEFKPRVIWAGVAASANLFEIAAAIEQTLEPLGFPRESRAFVPHLTLARINSTKGIENLVRAADALKSYDFGSARESEFHLFESVLKRSGAEYKKLASYSFVEGAA